MTIQDGFFKQPYQFAMEIDPLTERMDTAFFTRQKNGQTNNQFTRNPGLSWFAWTEIRASFT